MQVHLLRMLQEREILRLGESRPRKIDARIIVATQPNLDEKVASGTFRADLLSRLRVARISLPALRERREDIPLLVNTFLSEFRTVFGKPVQIGSHTVLQRLMEYAWPGNVRELKSAMEYVVSHCQGTMLHVADLPPEFTTATGTPTPASLVLGDEKQQLLAALAQARGNRRKAARLLGIGKSTLYRRLAQYHIS